MFHISPTCQLLFCQLSDAERVQPMWQYGVVFSAMGVYMPNMTYWCGLKSRNCLTQESKSTYISIIITSVILEKGRVSQILKLKTLKFNPHRVRIQ